MQTCTKILQVAAMNKKAVWQYRCGINTYQSHWKEHFPPLASSTSQIKLGKYDLEMEINCCPSNINMQGRTHSNVLSHESQRQALIQ